MLRKTTKILAVALTVTACGGTTTEVPEQPAATTTAPSNTAPAIEPGTTPPPPSTTTATATPKSEPEPTPACDVKALNEALGNKTLDQAVTEHEEFRCLCDDDGYPLVGNINAKGATASQFCSAVKDKGLL